MKARRLIFQGIVGLIIIQATLLYLLMYGYAPGLNQALVVSLFTCVGMIGLIFSASWLAHLKGGKPAAYSAMGWVLLIGLVIIASGFINFYRHEYMSLRWNAPTLFDALPMVLLTLLICGAVQVLAIYLKQFKILNVSAWIIALSAVCCAVLICAGLYIANFNGLTRTQLPSYAAVVAALSFVAACICVGKWRWHNFAGLGLILTTALLFVLQLTIPRLPDVTSLGNFICIYAIAYAHVNILWQMSLPIGRLSMIRMLTLGLIITVLIMINIQGILVWQGVPARSLGLDILTGLSAILEVIALMITLAMLFYVAMIRIRINRQPADNQINYSTMQVTCPHCQTALQLTESGQLCITCGLQFNFHLIEPRCPDCHYLLIGNTHDNCPECGAVIRTQAAQPVGLPST